MTRHQAEALGWTMIDGNPPKLHPLGGGVFYTKPGTLAAEKVLMNHLGYAYTHRVEFVTENPDEWPGLEAKRLAEIERLEALQAARRGAA